MDKKALYKISYGLYVVSSKKGAKFNGQIANTVFQITSQPPTIAVSISKDNFTNEFIRESRVFSVSILSENTPLKFIGHFGFRSGRDIEKIKDINYKIGMSTAPIVLENTIGYLEAEVVREVDMETHTIFVGKVVDAQIIDEASPPMTYEYYHKIKGGKAPKAAPTYVGE